MIQEGKQMAKAKIDYSIERQAIGGTYRKRLNDAFEAFDSLKVDKLSQEIALIFYFFDVRENCKNYDRDLPTPAWPGSKICWREMAVQRLNQRGKIRRL